MRKQEDRKQSTLKILDYLQAKMPGEAELTDDKQRSPAAKMPLDEDMMPAPEGDLRVAQGSNPRRRRRIPGDSDKIDKPVEATNMASRTKTKDLVDRLLS